jgi:hypothetical protein
MNDIGGIIGEETFRKFKGMRDAYNCLVNYFSRLGGARTSRGMNEREIPLYIFCYIVSKFNSTFKNELMADFVSPLFLKHAEPILNEVHKYIDEAGLDEKFFWFHLSRFMYAKDKEAKEKNIPEYKKWDLFFEWFKSNYEYIDGEIIF